MAEPVTIDNYGLESHRRYATDQIAFDPKYIKNAGEIPAHLETAASELSIRTKFDELFDLSCVGLPFAYFSPPPFYAKKRKRFFKHSISDEFDWDSCEKEEDKEDREVAEALKEAILSKKSGLMPTALFEEDRSSLIELVDSISKLNGWLKEVHARRLQYQKG